MALKFLNKKGWHTGSLRNIENVWKAEQKHDAEQKKLEELRKQIQEERERHEFRLLQEQAGITPKQERLDFLYESGLAVGKSSEGFKALQAPTLPPSSGSAAAAGASGASSSNAAAPGAPGALFEEKPQSANDAWRKLHSDPLLLIRQREQEALARVRSNPIQMAMIRKTVEAEKDKGNKKDKHKKKHRRDKKSKHGRHSSKLKHSRDHSDSEEESEENERKEKRGPHEPSSKLKRSKDRSDSEEESGEDERRKEKRGPHEHPSKLRNSRAHSDSEEDSEERGHRKEKRARGEHSSKARHVRAYSDSEEDNAERQSRIHKRDRDDPSKSERDVRSKLSKRSPSRDSEYTRSKEKSRDHENSRYSSKEKARYTEHTGNDDKEKHEREGGHSSKTRQVRAYSDSEEDNAERQNRIHKRDRDNSPKFERDVSSKLSKRSPPSDSEYTRNKEKSRDYESSRYSSKEKAGDTERSGNDNMEKPEREGGYRLKYDNRSGTRPESQETKERHGYGYNRRRTAPKLTEEERAARLREMQLNAELHEEQRWKRLKKASEVDAREAIKDKASAGQRTFLDDAKKSIYGTEKGGSSTIEESVRRRTYYLQGGSAAAETNAFRR